jgi:hypothetical protein
VNSNIHEAALGRPAALAATGMFSGEAARANIKRVLRCGEDPDVIGKAVLEGIRRNEFHIFTHPGFVADIGQIHDEIISALPAGDVPPAQQPMEAARRAGVSKAKSAARSIDGWA